ncbi:formate dehydrogenase-N subunit alpha [Desulfolutivibrio sulfoxidireducens]|uniref:formate dehydrogenase-N subunit alpha n=1 Tax=Desulfolutivibrio sulfoxidireducens TaxID=2773299 RepID=UPI00159D050B|nr:formate dehydrogenase-N subunit alpha [Desulfolutivibrio sulfoxidireducens]QLA15202.1 formate dehydrogenase-N subunit alpha [Desulfolutivibrio sulfoxidireducens]
MSLHRRDFLKLSGAGAMAAAFGGLGFNLAPVAARAEKLAIDEARQTTTICPYCSVGCGLVVSTAKDGKQRAINIEGDPDHPINEGALCAKGASLYQLVENDKRFTKVLYRAPYSDKWEEKSWNWAIETIAKRVKDTRDATFKEKNDKGQTINRCEGLASVGSAALDNEECWVYQAFLRALGLVYIEHQARICHSSTVPALAESFGRGAMTNHYIDIKNSNCVLIMGGNSAETHPVCFKWVMKAMENGAPLIHVDPRFTRTSAKADIHAPLRSGTDIAFLGGMIKYILDNDLIFKEYVVNYTNAPLIVGKDYDFKDGLFSGYDEKSRKYDKKKWAFEMDDKGIPKRDPSLKDPRCVYQLMKKHYSRYDLKTVSSVTGTPEAKLAEVYKTYSATGKPDKSGTILYAMGWTQHTVGVQNIRTMCLIQLLLGNMGVAGGGVNALRGEGNVQGSTDQALLYHIIPGYLPTPRASVKDLAAYNAMITPVSNDPKSLNWKKNQPKYMVSLLKAMFKDADPAEAYSWMPKLDDGQDGSWLVLFDRMFHGAFKGFFAWGMNPAASGANSHKTREALTKLDWMVNVNLFDNETGSFWRGPGMDPSKIKTEVFFLPAAVSAEKEGSITNSGRWMQWRYGGPKPLGDSKPDGDMIYELAQKIRELYAKDNGAFPAPIKGLNIDDWGDGHVYDPHKAARLINGYYLKDVPGKAPDGSDVIFKAGTQVASFANLKDDGSTCSGNWIYCGSYTGPDKKDNKAAKRSQEQTEAQAKVGLFPNWSWSWPVNRRIIYNRASVNEQGVPYQPQKPVLAWEPAEKKWVIDVPDGGGAPGTIYPFIMQQHGLGALFGPGLNDGPFPEHYEPMECPITKHALSKTLNTPTALIFAGEEAKRAVCDPRYPFVCSTYRVTEHWQTGVMTRWTPWLLEAEPQMFCEMSPELAELRGIKNGEKVILDNPRGQVWAIAMVTKRFKPFTVMGNTIHQVGIPWHYGWVHPKDGGDSANLLTPSVGDPNTGIPETKAFMVNVRKA